MTYLTIGLYEELAPQIDLYAQLAIRIDSSIRRNGRRNARLRPSDDRVPGRDAIDMQLGTAGIRRIESFHIRILICCAVEDDQARSTGDAADVQFKIFEFIENARVIQHALIAGWIPWAERPIQRHALARSRSERPHDAIAQSVGVAARTRLPAFAGHALGDAFIKFTPRRIEKFIA